MNERICSIDGCVKSARCRGWCPMHYQRWRQNGSPDIRSQVEPRKKRPKRVGVEPCSIQGCETPIKARNFCATHYSRWRRKGDPLHRLAGEVVDGKRICPSCGIDKPVGDFPGREGESRPCRPCQTRIARAWRLANPDKVPKTPTQPRSCDNCGVTFEANKRRNRYCSPECFAAYRHRANWKHVQTRRARLKGVLVETFDSAEIYERDDWICGLCNEPIDRAAPWPRPLSPSIDHIMPISRGGTHERSNVQASHLGCNVRKNDKVA